MNHESNPGLHHLLCSNVVPNTCEAAFFQLRIDDITSQISQLRSRLSELEDQLQLHRAVLSPVRRTPVEILGQIFAHFLPDILQASARDNLVEIQLVCKSWRDAARLTHKLWSALYFEDLTSVAYKKIRQWFDRAGSIPKHLAYSAVSHDACTDQSVACGSLQSSAIATLLVSLEGTLDHLSLKYKGPKCLQNLLDSLGAAEGGPTPQLRRPWYPLKSITLEFNEQWIESPNPLQSMFHHLPPNITSFELRLPSKWSNAFEDGEDSSTAPLPLPQNLLERLSSFTLRCNWDGTQWLEAALGHCVNVETLTMDFMGSYWSYDEYHPHTERLLSSGLLLPKVRTLRLKNVFAASIDILSALKAPQLVELDIDFDCDIEDNYEFSQPLLSFVKRSECDTTFRSFHLRHTPIRTEELSATLRGLPFLTHLTLEDVTTDTTAGLIDAFEALEDGPQRYLPNLEALNLLQLQPDFYFRTLLNFLESHRPYRMENGKPVFTNPHNTFKQLTVTYQTTTKTNQELGRSEVQSAKLVWFNQQSGRYPEVVEVLRKWGGVSVNIGPILYAD
ncbi:hypothetical protein EST38_g2186 [Candolleomyces aberdarensis]|uniref:F-box domain-containing protein n=1 Tax=Candolleomyces aberdarensis TaxID=2316362 RepID=A0A4Q2DT32_9AGAR|nr:hypothetical protein EST38_g2186 [Candolleomyces aberdarensis]